MKPRRLQFRTVDLLLVTAVAALTVMAVKEDPISGTAHAAMLLVLLAGMLGAVTGRLVSDAFRFGFVGGLLLGVLGYNVAVLAISLGIKIGAVTLFLTCVSAGGVIGGLIPITLHRWRHGSARTRRSILLMGCGLLVLFASRWRTVSEHSHLVAELQAAGAIVSYSDVNPCPTMFDSRRMQSRSEWLRELLGLRVVTGLTLRRDFASVNPWSTNALLPLVEDLAIHANHIDDETFELLNSGKLSRLHSLRFTGREFGDTSLARLHSLPDLIVLDLDNTSVTDESVEHITSFPRLNVLSVRQTDLTEDGVKRLRSKIGRVLSAN